MSAADTPNPPDEPDSAGLDRRRAIKGISAMGLAAFAAPLAMRPGAGPNDPVTDLIQTLTGTKPAPAPAPPKSAEPPPKPASGGTAKVDSPKGSFVKTGEPLGTTDMIPANSGYLFEADEYIVTQPKPGHFVGFDSLCTHEGCPVDVFDKPGVMSCSCHSTNFKITNGKVISGPAKKPMPFKPIVIENGNIYRAKPKKK